MMNGVEVQVGFSGDVDQALSLAAEELGKLGYEMNKHDGGVLKMKFKGKWFTTDPAKMKHQVEVKPSGDQLTFAFGTGLIASHWNDDDRAWAQGRANDIVAAVRAKLDGG